MVQLEPVARPSSLTDLAHARLRTAILDGDFAPGETLSVVALSEALNMSRSPVRAAVERLTTEGLLGQAGASVVVRAMSRSELLAALEVRAPLEGLAAELATPRLTDEQRAALRGLHSAYETAVSSGNIRTARKADLEFHQAIQTWSGNPVLIEHLERVQARVVVATYSAAWGGSQHKAVAEHQAVLEAVTAGDPRAAHAAASAHVINARLRAEREWAG
ncbi:GntR family transcriptional regulator [Blastococcus atacamensis]|uniref:GntR family transcriptional regulator n=1 Tax=Blastococcus atacamensis TaxID=2070508 RepID=UPI000CEBE641|nr:GntR family transcriptional regulator [Blastococcus atacamensis]